MLSTTPAVYLYLYVGIQFLRSVHTNYQEFRLTSLITVRRESILVSAPQFTNLKKMNKYLLVVIVLLVVVAGVAGYWFTYMSPKTDTVSMTSTNSTSSTGPSAPAASDTGTPASGKPVVTIAEGALQTDSVTPRLSGNISGLSSICVFVGKTTATPPAKITGPSDMPGYAFSSCSSTGGVSIANGTWTTTVASASGAAVLAPGAYSVVVTDGNTNYTLTGGVLSIRK